MTEELNPIEIEIQKTKDLAARLDRLEEELLLLLAIPTTVLYQPED